MYEELKNTVIDVIRTTKPVRLLLAEVVAVSPSVKIRIGGDMKKEYSGAILHIAEHLTAHARTARIGESSTITTIKYENQLKTGDNVMVAAVQGGQSFFIFDRMVSHGAGT